MTALAIYNGQPIRTERLPYCAHSIEQDDIDAVENVLRHGWLTNGPKVEEFESKFAKKFDLAHAVSFSSGTTALIGAMHAMGIGPGDEVIVPALTFVASVNCLLFVGARPVFCDVEPASLLIDGADVVKRISSRARAILAVDYAGQPCDYDELNAIAKRHGLLLVSDASHSIGAKYNGRPVGGLADITTFSFHPTKNITTGEGGMLTTNSAEVAQRARRFRSHGTARNVALQDQLGAWHYEMIEPGYNFRLSDIHSALGISQLDKLDKWVARRRQISQMYRKGLETIPAFVPLIEKTDLSHAYHLFVVRTNRSVLKAERAEVFKALQAEGIGVNVHYTPVHLHPYYRDMFGTCEGLCPQAELASEELITLPMFPQMTDTDTADVLKALSKVADHYACE